MQDLNKHKKEEIKIVLAFVLLENFTLIMEPKLSIPVFQFQYVLLTNFNYGIKVLILKRSEYGTLSSLYKNTTVCRPHCKSY